MDVPVRSVTPRLSSHSPFIPISLGAVIEPGRSSSSSSRATLAVLSHAVPVPLPAPRILAAAREGLAVPYPHLTATPTLPARSLCHVPGAGRSERRGPVTMRVVRMRSVRRRGADGAAATEQRAAARSGAARSMCGEGRGLRGWDLPLPNGGEADEGHEGPRVLLEGLSAPLGGDSAENAVRERPQCRGSPGGRGAARRYAESQRGTRRCPAPRALRADRSTRGAVRVPEPRPPSCPVGCCGCPTSSLGLRTAVRPSFSPYLAFVLFHGLLVNFACSHVSLFFFPFLLAKSELMVSVR